MSRPLTVPLLPSGCVWGRAWEQRAGGGTEGELPTAGRARLGRRGWCVSPPAPAQGHRHLQQPCVMGAGVGTQEGPCRLGVRKPRHREVESPAQGHPAGVLSGVATTARPRSCTSSFRDARQCRRDLEMWLTHRGSDTQRNAKKRGPGSEKRPRAP
ncbi:uncharacterized protein LOC119518553 isoform X2 [Choloepus didactylus]|uniref:uncharacterized protein LOC119518553 isoform X2 n=1 Tax=Choloepus didactylus TaxID=27675 RepID=UPI0018A116C7|nr:uncharacterized protein LOC119518553 isoform X2 [Choloepus didactylus]